MGGKSLDRPRAYSEDGDQCKAKIKREKLKRRIGIQPISLLRPIKGRERRQHLI
jgi:hypothetical protein